MRHAWVVAVALGLQVRAVPAQVLINEIYPDPVGSDAGREFVELFNPGSVPVPLDGLSFQFANGADSPASWQTRWTATTGDTLPGWGFFLIVDTNWLGGEPADAVARLGLQNGPDAVRLVRAGEVLDLVGYGPLAAPDLFEGAPAATATGLSTARRPDGRDTDNNAEDFRTAEPTPGRPNFPARELEVRDWSAEPPACAPGGRVVVRAEVVNTGLEALETSVVYLEAGEIRVEAAVAGLPPDQPRTVRWEFVAAAAGRSILRLLAPAASGDTLAVVLGPYQTGPGPVVLNEVMAAPDRGQGEWVELLCLDPAGLDLGGLRLRDEDGSWHDLPPLWLGAGEVAVAAQDTAALAGWIAATGARGDPALVCADPAARLFGLSGWPSLNNTPPADRDFSDRVWLADSLGVLDAIAFGGDRGGEAGVPLPGDGRSLERTTATGGPGEPVLWRPCAWGGAGSPGCPLPPATAVESREWLSLSGRTLDRIEGPASLAITLEVPPAATGFALRIYDIWGRGVRLLAGDERGPGARLAVWLGEDDTGLAVPPGGYILVGELTAAGRVVSRERVVLGVR